MFDLIVDVSQHVVQYGTDQEVWVESLDTVEEKKIGIRKLNADVFAGTVQYSTLQCSTEEDKYNSRLVQYNSTVK